MSTLTLCAVLVVLGGVLSSEPACSRFHFEEQTLSKVIRFEFIMEKMRDEIKEVEKRIDDKLKTIEGERQTILNERQTIQVNFSLFVIIHLINIYCIAFVFNKL